MFLVGMSLYGTLALLPPMLQNLMDYPVVTTGLVTAPRGVGTMIAMILVGRLIGKVDMRLIILTGLALTALALWQMTDFTLQMEWARCIIVGAAAGLRARLRLRAAQHR